MCAAQALPVTARREGGELRDQSPRRTGGDAGRRLRPTGAARQDARHGGRRQARLSQEEDAGATEGRGDESNADEHLRERGRALQAPQHAVPREIAAELLVF